MANRKLKNAVTKTESKPEHILSNRRFWLMGNTTVPQPVITTAQFPVSASHAGMP